MIQEQRLKAALATAALWDLLSLIPLTDFWLWRPVQCPQTYLPNPDPKLAKTSMPHILYFCPRGKMEQVWPSAVIATYFWSPIPLCSQNLYISMWTISGNEPFKLHAQPSCLSSTVMALRVPLMALGSEMVGEKRGSDWLLLGSSLVENYCWWYISSMKQLYVLLFSSFHDMVFEVHRTFQWF